MTTERVLRRSTKLTKAGYFLVAVLIAGTVFLYFSGILEMPIVVAPAIVAGVLLLIVIYGHLLRLMSRTVLTADKVRYETGLLSRSTRTIQLSKVQDVRVDQSISQRLLDIGDISLETAGETSRFTMREIDAPQATADLILQMAHHATANQLPSRGHGL